MIDRTKYVESDSTTNISSLVDGKMQYYTLTLESLLQEWNAWESDPANYIAPPYEVIGALRIKLRAALNLAAALLKTRRDEA